MLIYDAPIVTNEANTITIDMLITHFVNEQQYTHVTGSTFPILSDAQTPISPTKFEKKSFKPVTIAQVHCIFVLLQLVQKCPLIFQQSELTQ